MTTIEYLALPSYKRILYKILDFFKAIPRGVAKFFSSTLVILFKKIGSAIINYFVNLYEIFVSGDYKTRTSYLVMGFGHLSRKSLIKGCMYLIYEIAFVIFMVTVGANAIAKIATFGYVAQTVYVDPDLGIEIAEFKDDSLLILLNFVITLILIGILIFLWSIQINENRELENLEKIGKHVGDKETLNSLVGKNFHKVLLAFPTLGVVMFTIIPLFVMILVGFTNYSSTYQNPRVLFDWVGTYNFQKLFGMAGGDSSQFAGVFMQILLWTLIWAIFATFTNYFLGMIVAMIINKKGIRFKKLWRTVLITTIAVPQFISLLFLSQFLKTETGGLNALLRNVGIISENIRFLEDGLITKITIIVVNMWIGIPYTMLMCSGILMNIPQDLYESARIDGASQFKMYAKITLPYMLFVTGPYLISNFVGNINNFNVIYLLSGGSPSFTTVNGAPLSTYVYGAGQTDLLITWLYKLAMGEVSKDYGVASVIGIIVFVVVATLSLFFYSRSNAVKNEGDFQ